MNPVQTEAQASPSFSLLLFTPYPSPLIPSPIMKEAPTQLADGERTALSDTAQVVVTMLGKCRLIDLSTGMPPCNKSASSSQHPKGSSWKLCNEYGTSCSMQHSYGFDNSLQHVFVECQPSSCFPPPSIGDCIPGAPTVACLGKRHRCPQTPLILQQRSRRKQATGKYSGRIDFVRLRIRVHGTLDKNRLWFRGLRLTIPWQILNGSVRGSDRRVGRKSEAMPSRYSTARFGGVTVVLAGDPKNPLFQVIACTNCRRLHHGMLTSGGKLIAEKVEYFRHRAILAPKDSQVDQINDMPGFGRRKRRRITVLDRVSSESQHRRDGVAPHSTRVLTTV
ncbi:BZ3500_MvSof-1268-A1-R1_Chr3-3g06552 [Microbotryum saponariae]|uniref:BZ3500_MvSof-1268-A1-R1_Chr3-3g06552 protein n=1 Tax=Microbotryum saponariae TaxID=289078 RepID=A0A2X0LFC2_9BASI|nr:BZ3500_MvSof-1268-A1-R1_Chr3-3g06552 [Microbotryum saponariae]SDA04519.1 BZ3501_MvSof-1269-A2-R1_Chr3-2g06239 [Microbotryum saponariae]